jgi:hypothetical protein
MWTDSQLQFDDSDDSGSDFDENNTDLPFPKPLSRSSFLAPDFDPATFLASLTNRHQTLEDLRLELRDLSQGLNKDLLDLVNENYQDFLSLGGTLQGGEEKVEEIRVGLLGFQRDVSAIQTKIEARQIEFQSLLAEKKSYRTKANVGKALLDVTERIEELEERLMIGNAIKHGSDRDSTRDVDAEPDIFESQSSDSDEDLGDGENGSAVISLKRLEHHIQKYLYITAVSEGIGNSHPFLVGQQPRLENIMSTLLLDLNTALEQAKRGGDMVEARTLKALRLYDLIGAESNAVTALKQLQI